MDEGKIDLDHDRPVQSESRAPCLPARPSPTRAEFPVGGATLFLRKVRLPLYFAAPSGRLTRAAYWPKSPSVAMRPALLPVVFLLAVGCGSTAGKTAPVLQAQTNPSNAAQAASPAQITAVVRNKANQAALKSCYERALKMDNSLTRGRVDVTVSIGTSGIVRRVVTKAPSSFGLVESCIKGAIKRWVFPPSTEEYATNFPLILHGEM